MVRKRPPLTPYYAVTRLLWALIHQNYTAGDTSVMVWICFWSTSAVTITCLIEEKNTVVNYKKILKTYMLPVLYMINAFSDLVFIHNLNSRVYTVILWI